MNLRFIPALLALFACLAAFTSRADDLKTIVILGDSLTAGYGLENPGADAYPALLQEKINTAQLPWRIVNAGISGDTTSGGARRMAWLLNQKIDLIIIALGGNDGLRGINPAITRTNLQSIIDQARAKYPEIQLVIAGMQMPVNMGADYTKEFREIFPAIAEKNHAALVPFLLDGVGARPLLNQPDLIHPTPAGQRILAENVWKVLQPLLKTAD